MRLPGSGHPSSAPESIGGCEMIHPAPPTRALPQVCVSVMNFPAINRRQEFGCRCIMPPLTQCWG